MTELLQWHNVCELGGDKHHRPPVVALTFMEDMEEFCGIQCTQKRKLGNVHLKLAGGGWVEIAIKSGIFRRPPFSCAKLELQAYSNWIGFPILLAQYVGRV